jgi:hypothetical protein
MKKVTPLQELCFVIIPFTILFFIGFSFLVYGGLWLRRNYVGKDASTPHHDLRRLYSSYQMENVELFILQNKPEKDVLFYEKSKFCQITLLQNKVNQIAIEYNARVIWYDQTSLKSDSLPAQLKLYYFKKINY